MREYIEHEGTIIAHTTDNKYSVQIVQQSACATCKAAALCTVAESKEKVVEAFSDGSALTVGQQVTVYGRTSLGYKALVLAVIIPLLLSLTALLIVTQYSGNELAGGLSAFIILVPYYIVLWTMRNKIQRNFIFYVKPQQCNIQ